MAIEFKCLCGAACSADQSQAGKMFTCPKCGLQIKVPMPKPVSAPDRKEVVGDMINQVADVTGLAPRAKEDREEALKDLVGEDALSKIRAESRQLRRALGDTIGITPAEESSAGQAPGAAEVAGAEAAGAEATSPGVSAAPGSQGAAAAGAPPVGGRSPLTRRMTAQAGEKSEQPKKSWGPPPKGVERAAHHLPFKRAMWLPVILVGLVCVGFAAWCALGYMKVPTAAEAGNKEDAPEFKDVPAIVGDARDEMWTIPRWITPAQGAEATAAAPQRAVPVLRDDGTVAYKDAGGELQPGKKVWLDLNGRPWAVPAGHEPFIMKNGAMVYNYTAAELAGTDQNGPRLKTLPKIVRNSKDEMWAIPRGTDPVIRDDGTVAYKDDKGEEVAGKKLCMDAGGLYYAIPAGSRPAVTKSGAMAYIDESGFEQLAEPADNWVRGQAESAEGSMSLYNSTLEQKGYLLDTNSADQKNRHNYLLFACFFGAVAVILLAMGTWLWHDVRIVRRATKAAEAEAAAADEAIAVADAADAAPPATDVPPPDDSH